ncbi:MAG: aminotransferase class-III [Gemmatimonadetes bacterium]|nr:aminotransferase class-III [Gemmatimonadota bacterium]
MAFKSFFGRGRDEAPTPSIEEPDDVGAADDLDIVTEPEVAPQRTWQDRAELVLPTGASTGSKRAAALYAESAADDLPTHFASAVGAMLTDANGFQYYDCTMALGAVALGYAEPRVTQAVIEAAQQGNVAGLSNWREVEVAERLCAMIPCAERAQLLKSGAEAVSAAIRLARAYTGREHIIACGYFGWHDWASNAPGVPASTKALVTRVPFDDIAALEAAVTNAGTALAAIVLEPVVERAPSQAWLERARALCDASGSILVFDELKTGFRVAPGGYQEVCRVTPDLAAFGKAMANGYPLAAVVGREAIMNAARDSWISSTLASESTALAAALAVFDWHDEADICATLADTGREMRAAVERGMAASGITGVSIHGLDQMWMMQWSDPLHESRFIAEAMREGVLFKRGAYNYSAIAHDESVILEIERAASAAFVSLREDNQA